MSSCNCTIALFGNISNINWRIEGIVIKQGTDNPDEVVPENQITVIDTGNILKGIIYLKYDETIIIKEGDSNFYFGFYNQYQWELKDNDFILFKRFGNDGRIIQSFGYNVRFTSDDKMQWFIESTGIESGKKSLRIITLYHQ